MINDANNWNIKIFADNKLYLQRYLHIYKYVSTHLDIYLHVVPGRAEPLEEEDHEGRQLHRHEGRDQPAGHAEWLWGER